MASAGALAAMVSSLGFDSFLAGIAAGSLRLSWRRRATFAILLGGFDGMATLLGAAIPQMMSDLPTTVLYLVCASLLIGAVRRNLFWLFALPLLLSLDNLASGAAAAEAPMLALTSAAMAASGLALGAVGRRAAGRLVTRAGPA